MNLFLKLKKYISQSRAQITKFLVVGASSALIDLALLILLKEYWGFKPTMAVALNQIFIILYNFLLNKYWSFETNKKPFHQFSRYVALVAFNYLLSILLMYVFHELIGLDYKLVRLGSIGLLFMFNFVVYKHWVYKEK